MAGEAIGGMFGGKRAFGGGMDAGKTYLTGETWTRDGHSRDIKHSHSKQRS